MSVFRQAREAFPDLDVSPEKLAKTVAGIGDPAELQLVAKLAEFPRVVEAAAQSQEPHRIAFLPLRRRQFLPRALEQR